MKQIALVLAALLKASMLLAGPVNEQMFLDVTDKNRVYLEFSGDREDAPLLLYVHGGPGNVVLGLLPFQSNVGRQLERNFLVAYLHQRGAGKSPPLADPAQQSFARSVSDLEIVVEFLTTKYRQRQVFVVGHSVGGMLAVMYAKAHQEKVSKLVLMSTATNVKSMLQDSYHSVLDWAKEERMTQAIADLSQINPKFDTWKDFTSLSRWANQARGGILRRFNMQEFVEKSQVDNDYPDWKERMSASARAMSDELLTVDLNRAASSLSVPALFISGRLDTIVAEQTVRRDYDNYKGTKKLVILDDSHHLPFVDQPDQLSQAIDQFLLQ